MADGESLSSETIDVLRKHDNYDGLIRELIKLGEIFLMDDNEFPIDVKSEIARKNREIAELYYYGVQKGECYIFENEKIVRKPVHLYPDEYKVRLVRYASYLYNPLESVEKSLRAFGKVLQIDKDDSCSHEVIGRILMDNKLYEQALTIFFGGLHLEKVDYLAHKEFHLDISDLAGRVRGSGNRLDKKLNQRKEDEIAIQDYHSEFGKIDFIDGIRHTASNCPYNHV